MIKMFCKQPTTVTTLVVIVTAAIFWTKTEASYSREINLDFLCSQSETIAYVTYVPWDCGSYLICMSGKAIITPCPKGRLYANAATNGKCEPAATVDITRCRGQIWNYIRTICFHNPSSVLHDPERCGQYYDCTVIETSINSPSVLNTNNSSGSSINSNSKGFRASSNAKTTLASSMSSTNAAPPGDELMPYLLECPYPLLFSIQTGSCQDYRHVVCGEREEPKAPCDYLQYLQLYNCTGPECLSCKQRHPSCVGLLNGKQPVPMRSDVLMECEGERTVNIINISTSSSFPLVGAN